jgi:histidinol-phosphatase (PHP family)
MIATYHNHSKWSDGKTTFREIYDYAKKVGVDEVGLSDHFCIYPDGTSPDWSLDPIEVKEYLTEVLSFKDRGEISIRVGLEYDWFEGHSGLIGAVAEKISLDYRIGAVHHVEQEQFDVSVEYWAERSPEERDVIWKKYWLQITEMASSGLFDIVAHLDLPKKLGFYPESDMGSYIDDALEAIRESKMVVELNTAGFGKKCASGYPSIDILKMCRLKEIPITLSSDSHSPEHILFEFKKGLSRLKESGYKKLARFREREVWFESLDEALKK